jgi:uncharacterized protein YunC (DUF1805 family)
LIEVDHVKVDGHVAVGVRVNLPESPPLLAIIGEKGFVMCGFLNIDAAETLEVAAATVSGVKTFDDVLKAEVRAATSKAEALGVKRGMSGYEALKAFF